MIDLLIAFIESLATVMQIVVGLFVLLIVGMAIYAWAIMRKHNSNPEAKYRKQVQVSPDDLDRYHEHGGRLPEDGKCNEYWCCCPRPPCRNLSK